MKNINDFPKKIIGDYVISPCVNAFEGGSKVSYWISKKGYTYVAYAFSANDPHLAESMLKDEYISGYISFFENMLTSIEAVNLHNSIFNEDLDLAIAKRLINEFCIKEYALDNCVDFTNLDDIRIAYTETEDGLFTIQSSVNLVDYAIVTKVNDSVVDTKKYDSLLHLIRYELKALNFDDLVYVEPKKLYPFYRKTLVGKEIKLDNNGVWTIDQITDEGKVALHKVREWINTGFSWRVESLEMVASTYSRALQSMESRNKSSNQDGISFKSENVDGEQREWHFKNVSELENRWVSEDCDLPANDDRIYDVHVYSNSPMLFTFEDLLRYLDLIDNLEEENA